MKLKAMIYFLLLLIFSSRGFSQIPVEWFAGHQRSTIDIMFFKFLKHPNQSNTRFLFFNRNRAGMDYRMTRTTYLPQFGFTEAFSYNAPRLKGWAPVAVVQVLGSGVYPKSGIQWVRIQKNITLFSWLVCDLMRKPNLDYFLLMRYQPELSKHLNLFSQLETLNTFPTSLGGQINLTQRVRLGIDWRGYQLGAGADLNESKINNYRIISSIGLFVRHVF